MAMTTLQLLRHLCTKPPNGTVKNNIIYNPQVYMSYPFDYYHLLFIKKKSSLDILTSVLGVKLMANSQDFKWGQDFVQGFLFSVELNRL